MKSEIKLKKYDMMNGITQSMLSSMSCPYKFYLGCNGIGTGKDTFPIYFGSMIHECLEYCHRENNFEEVYVKKNINKFITQEKTNLEPEEIERASLYTMVILPLYSKFYTDNFEIYSLEKEFAVKFFNALLRGKIDGIIKLNKNKSYTLFEHKTKSRIDLDVINFLELNFQVLYYIISAEKLFGIKINSVLYNIIRTPSIKQGRKETLSDFKMRLKFDIERRPDFYFIRHNTIITDKQKKEFKIELKNIMKDVKRNLNNPYKNKTECFKGFKCQYLDWCAGNKTEYKQKELFQELKNVSKKERRI